MAQDFTKLSDLQDLLKAIKKYIEELTLNYNVLKKAANICNVAMGSDDLSKKHIDDLVEALAILEKAAQEAEDATYIVIDAIRDYDSVN